MEEISEVGADLNPNTRIIKLEKLLSKSYDESERFSLLPNTAKTAFDAGNPKKADRYARELLKLSQKYEHDPNFGSAIHDGNLVLGRIAAKEGKIGLSKEYLIKAAKTPGNTVLSVYGPNMSLAKDLLNHNEYEIVIEYLILCKRFWKNEDGRIDSWIAAIKGGGMPYFGNNLYY